jgi:hypothetical protein
VKTAAEQKRSEVWERMKRAWEKGKRGTLS